MRFIFIASIVLLESSVYAQSTGNAGIPRYQIVFSPHARRDTYLLDNVQGRVWIMTADKDGNDTLWQRIATESDESFQRRSDSEQRLALKKYVAEQDAKTNKQFSNKLDVAEAKRKTFDYPKQAGVVSALSSVAQMTWQQWYHYKLLDQLKVVGIGTTNQEDAYSEAVRALIKKTARPDGKYPAFIEANAQFNKDYYSVSDGDSSND